MKHNTKLQNSIVEPFPPKAFFHIAHLQSKPHSASMDMPIIITGMQGCTAAFDLFNHKTIRKDDPIIVAPKGQVLSSV